MVVDEGLSESIPLLGNFLSGSTFEAKGFKRFLYLRQSFLFEKVSAPTFLQLPVLNSDICD